MRMIHDIHKYRKAIFNRIVRVRSETGKRTTIEEKRFLFTGNRHSHGFISR